MKFGKQLEKELEDDGIPAEWRDAAIQYKNLKKCIKSVVLELAALGLNATTLKGLVESQDGTARIQYSITKDTPKTFAPKLVLRLDPDTSAPISASLTQDTKDALQEFMAMHPSADANHAHIEELDPQGSEARSRSIEISLTADSRFFRMLTSELMGLEALQQTQKTNLTEKITSLGRQVSMVASPPKFNSRSDLYLWREIFKRYLEAEVFFSIHEQGPGQRSADQAQERVERLVRELDRSTIVRQFKDKKSEMLLHSFLDVNVALVRYVRFQAINQLATTKILKKFEKRTALTAGRTFRDLVGSTQSFITTDLARGISYTMEERLLSVVPQLDDYSCPICSSLAVKPVRLSCGHLFCIRCLVKLQRSGVNACPICRRGVVMEADSTFLDEALLRFLKIYFPKEAKEKQNENEREVAIEQYGSHGDIERCTIM